MRFTGSITSGRFLPAIPAGTQRTVLPGVSGTPDKRRMLSVTVHAVAADIFHLSELDMKENKQ
jgi:hypothetical protein